MKLTCPLKNHHVPFINRSELNLTTCEVARFSVCVCVFLSPCLKTAMKLISICDNEFGGEVFEILFRTDPYKCVFYPREFNTSIVL